MKAIIEGKEETVKKLRKELALRLKRDNITFKEVEEKEPRVKKEKKETI